MEAENEIASTLRSGENCSVSNEFLPWERDKNSKQENANDVAMVSHTKRETYQSSLDSCYTPYLTTRKDKQSKYLDS